MSWLWLFLAIGLEVCGTLSMKRSEGFTRPLPAALMFGFYAFSLSALTMALKRIDLSIAYAVWAGLGTALITMVGVVWFREPFSMVKAVSIALIIVGVVLLNLDGGAH